MKHVFLSLVYFFVFIVASRAQELKVKQPLRSSERGEVFTPKGDLRALIIYAGFKGYDFGQEIREWPADQDLPSYVKNGAYLQTFYNDTSYFENTPTQENKSISRLFYEMSGKRFRFMADVYPERININPGKLRSWGQMNLEVIKTMKKQDPNFDWAPYDTRKNRPNYLFDNSLTEPDGKPDYVIVIYRYNRNWKKQPKDGMNRWTGSGGGISVLQGVNNFKYSESITVGSDGFHMNTVGVGSESGFIRLFKHELGHELLSCPHHFGTGGTLGEYFRSSNFGWGTSVSSVTSTLLINGWERWMLGWIELEKDLKDEKDNGIYNIKDYATTGDIIRIKIPHTKSQYLWIENHQLESIFDHNPMAGDLENQPEGSSGIAEIDKGLYFFVEDIMDDREKIKTYIVSDMKRVNGTQFLNASGNWDYKVPKKMVRSWAEYWKNKLFYFEREAENPYSGINPFVRYRFDENNNGKIENRHNFNTSRGTESVSIVKEVVGDTALLFYSNHGGVNRNAKPYRRSQAFVLGDTLSICHNPPIVNRPRYIPREGKERPVFLNGIKISVIDYVDGVYTLDIRFDNNTVNRDLRIAGNIVLKDIPNTAVDFSVLSNKTVTVDKSGTINCLNKLDGSFIHETTWVIDSAVVAFGENSELEVRDSSIVLFKKGSEIRLKPKAKITVKDKAQLLLSAGSHVFIDNRSIVVCEKQGVIKIQKGATINGKMLTQDFSHPLGERCTGKQLLKALEKMER